MRTRITIIFAICLLTSTLVQAQETGKTGTSFGILGGVNFQNLNGKDHDGNKLENDMIPGFHAGVNIQIPIAPAFYFQPGILYSLKGAKSSVTVLGTTFTTTTRINYIEMPLNFMYKGALGNGFVLIGFGPYVGYAFGGKVKTEGGSVTIDDDIVFQKVIESGDDLLATYYKSFDAGANIFAGYEMNAGLFIQLNAQLGMLSINPEDKRITNDEAVVKNTGFGLSLGYRF